MQPVDADAARGVQRWERTVTLYRGEHVEIADTYALAEPVREIALSLLTPCEADLGTPGEIALSEALLPGGRRAGKARVTYDAGRFTVSTEEVPITDTRLGGIWGTSLTRLVFRAVDPPQQGTWTVRVHA